MKFTTPRFAPPPDNFALRPTPALAFRGLLA